MGGLEGALVAGGVGKRTCHTRLMEEEGLYLNGNEKAGRSGVG